MGSIPLAALLIAVAAAAPSGPALPFAAGAAKGGARVVVVAAPGGPWATVQLHVRTAGGDLSALEQQALEDVAAALAEGRIAGKKESLREALSRSGGLVATTVAVDELVVAWGAPAAQADALLLLVDEVLRSRGRLQPAPARPARLPHVAEGLSAEAAALVAPGHPYARSGAPAAPPDARLIAAVLARLCTKERVVVAVVGPRPAADLLAQATKALSAPLPSVPFTPAPFEAAPGTRLSEQVATAPGATSTVWLFLPPTAAAAERAARRVLARLVNGRGADAAAAAALALDVVSADAAAAPAAEGRRIDALAALARTPPRAEDVARAAAAARGALMARLVDPDALALALGRALAIDGDAASVNAELAALGAVTPADVAAAATAAANGPRAVVRRIGARR